MIRFLILGLVLALSISAGAGTKTQVFRLHLLSEPASLKPWEQKNSSGIYLLGQIYGSLLKFENHELKGSLAEKCELKTPLKIVCLIRKDKTFSDNTPIKAKDFERSFQEFLKPENHAFRADLLFPVKNAEAYFLGQKKVSDLGIHAKSENSLEFDLEKEDPEFIYNLSSPLLTVFKEGPFPSPKEAVKMTTSGAFKVLSWESQKKITLIHRTRPELQVEFLFITEDSVALNLYEKGELQFLRRLPTLYIPKYKDRADYHAIDQIRFDYIGFGPELQSLPELRQALSQSLQFSELNKILFTKGSFGCSGLLATSHDSVPCVPFDVKLAQKTLRKMALQKIPNLTMYFSKQGGDDFKRTMEWIQSEWKKNLNISVNLEQMENRLFVDFLKTKKPSLYRKGVAPDRPTCLSALETFNENSQGDYFKRFPVLPKLFSKLQSSALQPKKYRLACDEITQYLLDQALIIPAGPISFTLLAKPQWQGWLLNELNHLDLSDLHQIEEKLDVSK